MHIPVTIFQVLRPALQGSIEGSSPRSFFSIYILVVHAWSPHQGVTHIQVSYVRPRNHNYQRRRNGKGYLNLQTHNNGACKSYCFRTCGTTFRAVTHESDLRKLRKGTSNLMWQNSKWLFIVRIYICIGMLTFGMDPAQRE